MPTYGCLSTQYAKLILHSICYLHTVLVLDYTTFCSLSVFCYDRRCRALGKYIKCGVRCDAQDVSSHPWHQYTHFKSTDCSRRSLNNKLPINYCCTDRVLRVRVCHAYAHAAMTYPIFKSCIVVFARLPVPGKAKTRLAASVGNEAAAEFYKLCAEQTFHSAYRLAIAFAV